MMQQRVMELHLSSRSVNHPETLASMDNVVGSLWGQQRLPEATEVLRASLASWEENFGEDNPETLIRMTRLAYLLRIQGMKEEAIELYNKALGRYEKTLGIDDPTTKECAECVADTLAEKVALVEV